MSQHPYVSDTEKELERLKKEKEEELNIYGSFGNGTEPNASGISGEKE